MDAFSFAISIGAFNIINRKTVIIIALTVGIFHFMMPIIGSILGNTIKQLIHIDFGIITGAIFLYIAIEMIKEFRQNVSMPSLSILGVLALALSVSVDSFAVGFTLTNGLINTFLSAATFSIFSFTFTLIGLIIGKYISEKFGDISKVVGISIMVILAILSIVKS